MFVYKKYPLKIYLFLKSENIYNLYAYNNANNITFVITILFIYYIIYESGSIFKVKILFFPSDIF